MRDKGKVTVFLCLIISAMVLLGTTAVKLVSLYCAKGKIAMASRTVTSDIKANYNTYIFEHYHILLFDKENYGNGEASLEERMSSLLKENLGADYDVSAVELTDFTMIYDNECEELKSQINEQMLYMVASDAVDAVKEKIGGSTGSCSDELLQKINDAESETDTAEAVTDMTDTVTDTAEAVTDAAEAVTDNTESAENSIGSAGDEATSKSSKKAKDPRDYTSSVSKEGMLLTVLLPPDAEVSNEKKVPLDVLSVASSWAAGVLNINTDFDSYRELKKDVKKGNTWGNTLSEKTELLVYESSVFNCFSKKDVNEGTVLECELEYLISGKRSDYENLESVCRKIIAIRFPLDMAYVVKDPDKIAVVKTISLPVAAITPFLTEPVLRYLIMAGWSYAEAIAETRNLLDGKKIDFVKTKENWITDLYDLSGSVEKSLNSDGGMEYKDYLLLLLAMQDDGVYYRMLDLMDINARQENSEFSMLNAAVGLGADFTVSYGGSEVSVHRSASYGE